jgi:hypothetical protein
MTDHILIIFEINPLLNYKENNNIKRSAWKLRKMR